MVACLLRFCNARDDLFNSLKLSIETDWQILWRVCIRKGHKCKHLKDGVYAYQLERSLQYSAIHNAGACRVIM
jgi:hypothetical protein